MYVGGREGNVVLTVGYRCEDVVVGMGGGGNVGVAFVIRGSM